jgi:hypothetical protein
MLAEPIKNKVGYVFVTVCVINHPGTESNIKHKMNFMAVPPLLEKRRGDLLFTFLLQFVLLTTPARNLT